MNNLIFREYDIRGIVGKDLNYEVVEMIGLAFGSTIVENGLKKISIGRDCRIGQETAAFVARLVFHTRIPVNGVMLSYKYHN